MDHSKDWLAPIYEPLPMPPILEPPQSVNDMAVTLTSSGPHPPELFVLTTEDVAAIKPVTEPAQESQPGETLQVYVEDGIGLIDPLA